MTMTQSKFSITEFETLSFRERQSLAIKLFNQAMEDDDPHTAIDVAEYVIGDEQANYAFGAGFQMHCLSWLSQHYRYEYSQTVDDSSEEDEYLEKLFSVLWKMKWIIARLPYDINITQEEIHAANDLMTHFYENFDFGKTALAKALMHQSIIMGDAQAAKQHFNTWQQGTSDFGNDCDACEQNSLVEYHHFIGDYAHVIELAQPILSGEMTCGEVPHITYEFVIDSLIHLNQHEKARDVLEQALDLLTSDIENNLPLLPSLIYLCTRVDEYETAKDLLDDFNDAILGLAPNNRLYYLMYLMCVSPFNDEGLVEAKKVAAEFDERNGNSFYQDKLTLMFGKVIVH